MINRLFLIALPAVLLLSACSKQNEALETDIQAAAAHIITYRAEKDAAFLGNPNSPIPDTQKATFTGLSYFPVDLRYRFSLKLKRYEKPENFKIVTSKGTLRDAEKYGYFDFAIETQPCTLQVYKLLDTQRKHPGYLFLPFLDATNNHESYGGGRYLDFQENKTDIYEVDFNMAYNPLCAYGKDGYNCPIPPLENRLHVALRAGEKMDGYAH